MNRCALALLLLLAAPAAIAQPSAAAASGFDRYLTSVETRLSRQHQSATAFVAPVDAARLHTGGLVIEALTPGTIDLPGALMHHWRGTAFAPGATAAGFENLMRSVETFPRIYAPTVVTARAVLQHGDRMQTTMRVREKHVITVVMDTAYDVAFARLDRQHGWSTSHSTRIQEIDSPGKKDEKALSAADEHGFLWRQNTYWTYEERDGGLYLQIESVSLSRNIPAGLGWAIRPFVESVPRGTMEFTLRATRNALQK